MALVATLGLIGAGKLGTTVGQLALQAGWDVRVHDSSPDPMLPLILSTVLPGAERVELPDAAASDVVVLAVPHPAVAALDLAQLSGRVVVDATNPWKATDSALGGPGSSADILALNPSMRLVKTLNHLAYADLGALALPHGHSQRRALVVAGDDEEAVTAVSGLVDDMGYDPVPVPFDHAALLEVDGPVFGRSLSADEMRVVLAEG